MDGAHDMGGMAGFGQVVPDGEVFHEPWERRLFALTRVSRAAGITEGHFREAIESMPPAEYLNASYYERWMYGLERRLERAGNLAPGDVQDALARTEAAPVPERLDPELTDRVLAQQHRGGPLAPAAAPRFAGRRARARAPHAAPRATRAARATCAAPPASIELVHGDDLLPDTGPRTRRARGGRLRRVLPLRRALRARARSRPSRVLVDLSEIYLEARMMHATRRRSPGRPGAAGAGARGAAGREAASSRPTRSTRSSSYYENDVGPQNGARVIARAWVDPDVPRAAARRRHRGDRGARLRRRRGRHDGRGREHARRAQRDRLHALLVLSVARARAAAHLVQERGLPRPRRRGAAGGAARVRARARPATSRCGSGTRAPRSATSCCPSGRRERTA